MGFSSTLPNLLCFSELHYNDFVFKFDKKLPIATILKVMSSNEDAKKAEDLKLQYIPSYYKCLNMLYCSFVTVDKYADSSYYLPEGIKEINVGKIPRIILESNGFCKSIREKSKGKIVYLPKSLEKISGNFFDGIDVKDIILQEGIKILGNDSLKSLPSDISEFIIPSSLEMCSKHATYLSGVQNIVFNNYTESKILNNPKELSHLLKSTLQASIIEYDGRDITVEIRPKSLHYILFENTTIDISDIKIYKSFISIGEIDIISLAYIDAHLMRDDTIFEYTEKLLERIHEHIELSKQNEENNEKSKVKSLN